jgi:hypothetical protein
VLGPAERHVPFRSDDFVDGIAEQEAAVEHGDARVGLLQDRAIEVAEVGHRGADGKLARLHVRLHLHLRSP